jgi:anti-sigma B factor antagonist
MDIQVTTAGSDVVVRFDGRFDFTAGEVFRSALGRVRDQTGTVVVFDFSKLTHVDSVGLGLLLAAKDELGGFGKRACVQSPNANVMRLLELTGADTIFEIRR